MAFDIPDAVKAKLPLPAQKVFADSMVRSMAQGAAEHVAMTRSWSALHTAGWYAGADGKYTHKSLKDMQAATPQPRNRKTTARTHTPPEKPARQAVELNLPIEKTDDDQRIVFGWASVIEKNGEAVVDRQGDVIDERTLVEAAHQFVSDARIGKAMHRGEPVAEIVESMVFTKDVQAALGLSMDRVGWAIAMKVHDDAVWKRVKSGELGAFSIGGMACSEDM